MSIKKIITVTLNPSLDRTLLTHFLSLGYHNKTTAATRLDAAGDGFDIARALHKLGASTQAIILLGEDATGRAYRVLAESEDFEIVPILSPGKTRSKTVIMDTGADIETQITEDPTCISEEALRRVIGVLENMVENGDVVVLAGALPREAPVDTYARLIEAVHGLKGEVVLASAGQSLQGALRASPEVITLTRLEMEGLFNYPVHEIEDVLGCANKLISWGAKRVIVELRSKYKALLASAEETWLVDFPSDEIGTTSGIWSALVAGYIAGRMQKHPLDESLELGAAAATYTAGQVGHEFGSTKQVMTRSEDTQITAGEDNKEE